MGAFRVHHRGLLHQVVLLHLPLQTQALDVGQLKWAVAVAEAAAIIVAAVVIVGMSFEIMPSPFL